MLDAGCWMLGESAFPASSIQHPASSIYFLRSIRTMNPQIVFNFYLGAEASKSAEQIVAAIRSHLPSPTDAFAVHAETLPTPMDNTGES
jgi:hypothetical protein